MLKYFSSIPPVFIDGLLYVWIAMTGFCITFFSADDATMFIRPTALFWLKGIFGCGSAGLLALKLYRSTSYAQHLQAKDEEKKEEKQQQSETAVPIIK